MATCVPRVLIRNCLAGFRRFLRQWRYLAKGRKSCRLYGSAPLSDFLRVSISCSGYAPRFSEFYSALSGTGVPPVNNAQDARATLKTERFHAPEFTGLLLSRIGKLGTACPTASAFFDSSQGFALYRSPDTPSLSILSYLRIQFSRRKSRCLQP